MTSNPVPVDVYTDLSQFAGLKARARDHAPEALENVAKQFEAVFMQMLLKSMREASFGDSIFGGDRSELFRDLYDKQLAIHLSRESGLGLSGVIRQQLGEQDGRSLSSADWGRDLNDYRAHPLRSVFQDAAPDILNVTDSPKFSIPFPASATRGATRFASQVEFVEKLKPHAINAARQLGVHPGVLLAQAAIESGWGKKPIRHPDGRDSYNLFGIKADNHWKGLSTVISTLEYHNGIVRNQRARFRSYAGFAESFRDYVRFIQDNPRYSEALRAAGNPRKYMEALQKAGYATDPEYATKVMNIFERNGLAGLDSDQV